MEGGTNPLAEHSI